MSYQNTMSTGAIIVAGMLLAFSDNSHAANIQENQKPAWATTTKAAKPATAWTLILDYGSPQLQRPT